MMNKRLIIGIDNGVTGSWGVVGEKEMFFKPNTINFRKYTKKEQYTTRLDFSSNLTTLNDIVKGIPLNNTLAVLERPMINPRRFVSSTSALRCWESTLILMESIGIPYVYIDSKEWQKKMLSGFGALGAEELKQASLEIGNKLYPQFANHKHPDRDGLLIASYYYNYKIEE